MINKILNLNIRNFLWLIFARKISRLFKIYFVPSDKKNLPKVNHPLQNLKYFFENQYINFYKNNFNFNKDLYRSLRKNFSKYQKIKILDFGGENIDLYLFLLKKFPNIHISVLNQQKLNNHLRNFVSQKKIKGINVLSDISKLKRINFNYVYFGSSLQYLRGYEKILKILLKKKIKYFNISATSYFNSTNLKDKIILKQVNLLPKELYCYCFNYKNIILLFKNNGYEKVFKEDNSYKKINFRNFPYEIKYLNILFKKKSI